MGKFIMGGRGIRIVHEKNKKQREDIQLCEGIAENSKKRIEVVRSGKNRYQ